MHFQLAIFYCKIMKLLCKLEDDLKQNTEAPTLENPSMVGQKQGHHLSTQYPSLPQELIIPRKRLEQKQMGSCFHSIHLSGNPPQ